MIISIVVLSATLLLQTENVESCSTEPKVCVNAENGGCCPYYRCKKDECGTDRCLSVTLEDWSEGDKRTIRQGCEVQRNRGQIAQYSKETDRKRCLSYIKGGSGSGVVASLERTCQDFEFSLNEVYGTPLKDGGDIKFPYQYYDRNFWQSIGDRIANIGGQFQSLYEKVASGDFRNLIGLLNDMPDPAAFVNTITGQGGVVRQGKEALERLAQVSEKNG